mgnify:CR=1 FL=1
MPVIDAPNKLSLAQSLVAEHYAVRGGDLLAGGFTIEALAERFGTPLYIYDAEVMRLQSELLPEAQGKRQQVEADLRKMAQAHDSTRGIDSFIFLKKLPVDKRHNAKIDRPALAREASEGKIH